MQKYKYQKIADDIEDGILDCNYQSGEKLPATTRIARKYEVHTNTANNAIELLEERGMINKVYNEGAFVVKNARAKLLNRKKRRMKEEIKKLIAEAAALDINLREEINQLDYKGV